MKVSDKSKEQPLKKVRRKIARIKLEFDKELEVLSGTILFPEKLDAANKFLAKGK